MTATNRLLADRCSGEQDAPAPDYALASAFLENRRGACSQTTLHRDSGAARHFLLWLDRRCIPVVSVDDAVVDRFAGHRCRCGRYSPNELKSLDYVGRVRRFVRFLEDRGDIPVDVDIEDIDTHLTDFAGHLEAVGYSLVIRCGYRSQAEHLAVWLRLSRIRWCDVDDAIIERFAQHDCRCPIKRKRGKLVEATGLAHRRRGALRFIDFLRQRGTIPQTGIVPAPVEEPRLSAFRVWLKRHRGATDETIRRYLQEASRWVPGLEDDPAVYDAATIRAVVLNQAPARSRASLRMTVTVLRSYLRFLAAHGECRPELVHAVPPVPQRRLAALPRYASPETIERIIASCDTATPVGIRDRAILLFLARLGLRAGDVWRLRLPDIDWANAQLCVHGKERRPSRLPLPQDVGDALLAYLTHARPVVCEERVFLRSLAPFTPFVSSSEIAGIVARALARSGIEGVPTGAHLFRHSLATNMLRAGANLESVGTVLRHRSPNTTAIYAKVDVAMLETVAQPWLGDVSC
jgi:site-specific recombinase XerD